MKIQITHLMLYFANNWYTVAGLWKMDQKQEMFLRVSLYLFLLSRYETL